MEDYSARYRAARGYANLSQEDLAEQLGVDRQTIIRRESGDQQPKRAERIAVAAITGVPLPFLEGDWEALRAPATASELERATAQLRQVLGRAAAAGQAEAPEGQRGKGRLGTAAGDDQR